MEATMPTVVTADAEPNFIRSWVQTWVNACNGFRRWEREELILKKPSPQTVAEHGKKVQTFILTARFLQGLMANPDYPAREFRAEVDGKVRQLEETRDMIHDPMADDEADAILLKAFPDGPRTGSPA